MFKYYLIYIAVMSFITYILYVVDKKRAKKNEWRIKESVLLFMSFIGGALGGYTAMILCHHKTKHWYFVIVNIVSLALHVFLGYYILTNL